MFPSCWITGEKTLAWMRRELARRPPSIQEMETRNRCRKPVNPTP
ncbi:MAG: hypothetical protein QXV08_03040 [Desulfurococcus sp.]